MPIARRAGSHWPRWRSPATRRPRRRCRTSGRAASCTRQSSETWQRSAATIPGEALIACGQDRGRTWSRQPPGRQRRHRAPREEPHIGDHDDDPGDAAPSRDRPRPGSRSAPIFHTDFHGLLLPRFLDLLARQRRMPIELVVCASRPTSGCHPDSDPETQRPRRLIGNRRRPGRATNSVAHSPFGRLVRLRARGRRAS